jgi:uncharacterized protein (TIGR03435 family)
MPKKLLLEISAVLIAALCPCAFAQTLAFEVASVKPAPPPKGPGISVNTHSDNGRITMSNVSLKDVLAQAYKVRYQQLDTPDWMENTRFDIVAKYPEGAGEKQIPEMLQTLLADRFKLAMHKESKVLPVYALVVAKGGPKLHPVDAPAGLSTHGSKLGREMKGKVTLSRLADALSGSLDRPVVDMTGISGAYEIDMKWSTDEGAEAKTGDTPDAPTIFTAIQETMGLKLEARKAPIDIIVVDHAEKVPTEN